PGYGSAQSQSLRCYHTYVAWGECLAQDTAVVYVYRLVGQAVRSLITFVKGGDRHLMTDPGTFCRIGVDHHFTFIYYGVELVLHLGVQHFTDVSDTEACIKRILADTDPLHVSLSGMVYTFDAVDVVVELTLDYRLEVCL